MIIYLASGYSVMNSPGREIELASKYKPYRRLVSFFDLERGNHIMATINAPKVDLFLDSGAYSAKTQGVKINISEYIQFIKDHQDILGAYANLDVIGNAAGTWENQRTMEKAGLSPLPVFHQGEDERYLKRYLKRYDYIALGGLVGSSTKVIEAWLSRIFKDYICDEKGWPIVKVHGFGLTSFPLLIRYPWYSVDSTSWVITGRLGSIHIPRYRGGKWIYDELAWKIAVSNRSPSSKEAGKHITTLTPKEKEIFLSYIHSKGYQLGSSSFRKEPQTYQLKDNERWSEKKPADKAAKRQVECIEEPGICNQYHLRDEMNIIFYLDLEKSLPEWPWQFTPVATQGLGL